MYFAHGWPKVYATDLQPNATIIHVHIDHQYILLVTQAAVQIWSSGQHRVKLGSCTRIQSELDEEGHNISAFWSSARNGLAVVTSRNHLHFYAIHTWKDPVVALGKTSDQQLRKVDVYLRHSVAIDSEANVTAITGDGRTLVLGLDDGNLVTYSWLGKPRGRCDALWIALDGLHLSDPPYENGSEPHTPPATSTAASGALSSTAVAHLHYSEPPHLLAITFSDGSCALYKVPDNGLHQMDQLELSSWLCTSARQAVCAQIGASAQMVAVGCMSGEIALYRLHPTSLAQQPHSNGADPALGDDPYGMLVRVLSLHDWGHRTQETGAAFRVQWSPDCRALAVGYAAQGVAVWSPSGCRLACSLRQTPSLQASVSRHQSLAPYWSDLADVVAGGAAVGVDGGVTALAWGQGGYQLVVAETGGARVMVELQFAKTLPNNHRVAQGRGQVVRRAGARDAEVHVLQAHDRLLMISDAADQREPRSAFREDADGSSSTDLAVHHVLVPAQYLAANWPIAYAAVSANGANLAVAGRRGLAVYSRLSERWRLFGDVSQERNITCLALCWLDNIIVVVSALPSATKAATTGACELLLFPRYHLDMGSLLGRYPLPTRPLAIDCVANFIIIATEPLELAVLQVELQGELAPSATPVATISLVRELSMMNAGLPLLDIALVPPPPEPMADNGRAATTRLPKHCVLLRWGGLMSVLDMELGSELPLSADIESFWLSDSHPQRLALPPALHRLASFDSYRTTDGDGHRMGVTDNSMEPSTSAGPPLTAEDEVEMPWWAYGAHGMQLWFPSSLAHPVSPPRDPSAAKAPMDIELEFDREVYPVGISWSDAAIIGLTQRLVGGMASTSASTTASASSTQAFPCFHLLPESQPVLPCLLRRLLQKGASGEALLLARRHQRGHHFPRSLEWLLFTALELDTTKRGPTKAALQAAARRSVGEGFSASRASADARRAGATPVSPLLSASAELIRQFPQFADVVVSVARKTDASLWPTLFAAVGSPSVLLEGLLEAGALRSAACFLLVIDRLEGSALAHSLALRLLRASLKRCQYHLAAELLRFVIPPGDLDNIFGTAPLPTPRRTGSTELPFATDQQTPSDSAPAPTAAPANQTYTSWLFSMFASRDPSDPSQPAPPSSAGAGPPDSSLQSSPSIPVLPAGGRPMDNGRLEKTSSGGRTYGPSSLGKSSSILGRGSGRKHVAEGLGDAPSLNPGADACAMVADHAWQLLEAGHLGSLAQLAAAMTFLPEGGLPALMNFSWETSQLLTPAPQPPACAGDLVAALSTTVQELPVWDNDRVQRDAETVLLVTRQVGSVMWAVVVAVVLVDVDTVVEFRQGYPEMWRDFADLVKADPVFEFLWEVVDALTAAAITPDQEQGGVGGGAGGPMVRVPSLAQLTLPQPPGVKPVLTTEIEPLAD